MTQREAWLQRYLRGEATMTTVMDEIDAWHDAETDLELHEWLGIQPVDYKLFVEDPAAFERAMKERREA